MGSQSCKACSTTLIYRYLWAVGKDVEKIPPGSQVGSRYFVTARRIWIDTQPSLPPDVPAEWSDAVLPYLHLYPYRLHVPEIYGFCIQDDRPDEEIFLLENVPLDESGILFPPIVGAWAQATAVRQVYWLWQLLQLWSPLFEQGVATSFFAPDNIRVEGWRVRLCQLFQDEDVLTNTNSLGSTPALQLMDLANLWSGWIENARPEVQEPLKTLCQQMRQEGAELATITTELNQILLEQAAQLPLRLRIAGSTTTGPERSHNEDACYPLTLQAHPQTGSILPQIGIVCDGIGGHEGGEVASQLVVQSLKLEAQALITEAAEQNELLMPDILSQQLESAVRVANNLVAHQNDNQGREDRRRMGTTLVMALQVPQRVQGEGTLLPNAHELYLVNVGDSRAYWITQRYCHQLTVDDDVATREVRLGRALYREALYRPDAGALTQAIGTRDADFLQPTIQRFILEEDGLLLLCSDGVSDNGLVERTWADIARLVLSGRQTLESATQTWLDLANQQNGYDNATIVLLHCHVSSPLPGMAVFNPLQSGATNTDWGMASTPLTQSSAGGATEVVQSPSSATNRKARGILSILGVITLLLLAGGLGVMAWSRLDPAGFLRFRDRVTPFKVFETPAP